MYPQYFYTIQKLLVYNFIFSCIVIYVGIISNVASHASHVDNSYSDAIDVIKRAGYPAESHFVTTDDGYILEMHRIPGRDNSIPVFLQHPLFGSSNMWLFLGENRSLAFLLADEGYDVWMGNNRGTTYGRLHTNLSVSDGKFWNFCQHELGVYDLSAEISYVNNFRSQSVILITFSMGAPISLIMTSEQLYMQSKIRAMIHLAPAVYLKNLKHRLVILSMQFSEDILNIAKSIGIYEVPPAHDFLQSIAKHLCNLSKINQLICRDLVLSIAGYNIDEFDLSMLNKLLKYEPDFTSTFVLNHYAQWYHSDHFRQYDHGKENNLVIYNRTTPPDYAVNKIYIPNIFFYSEKDIFADTKDVFRLYNQFPLKAGLYKVNQSEFSHLDFGTATHAPQLLYNHIIMVMKDYK